MPRRQDRLRERIESDTPHHREPLPPVMVSRCSCGRQKTAMRNPLGECPERGKPVPERPPNQQRLPNSTSRTPDACSCLLRHRPESGWPGVCHRSKGGNEGFAGGAPGYLVGFNKTQCLSSRGSSNSKVPPGVPVKSRPSEERAAPAASALVANVRRAPRLGSPQPTFGLKASADATIVPSVEH